jgi:hypothetical protein
MLLALRCTSLPNCFTPVVVTQTTRYIQCFTHPNTAQQTGRSSSSSSRKSRLLQETVPISASPTSLPCCSIISTHIHCPHHHLARTPSSTSVRFGTSNHSNKLLLQAQQQGWHLSYGSLYQLIHPGKCKLIRSAEYSADHHDVNDDGWEPRNGYVFVNKQKTSAFKTSSVTTQPRRSEPKTTLIT